MPHTRPAQASRALRPAGLLNRPRRPLSRGSSPVSCPTKPLVSYRSNRQLSGWNPPPVVIRAVGAHVESRTGAVAWALCGNAPFPVPAHQTGRADFPHPAFRLVSARGTRRDPEFGVCCRSSGRWQTRPSSTDRRPPSPQVKASSEASGCSGVFQAHRPSPILGSVQSAPEVRALSSASMTRPPRSYGPLRLPSDPPPVRRWAASPRRDGSPPMTRITLPACRAPYPGGSRRVPASIASPLTRPSPFPRRVGIRIFTFEMLWGGRWRDVTIVAGSNAMERPMAQQLDDLSRSLTPLEQDSTIISVIEMSQASWLVAGIVPGIERHPLKKLEPSEVDLLRLLMRWRAEATQKGRTITRIAVTFEAGRDGFWLARWLRARGIEAYVIHATSVAVSREHRRAKTDRLDTGLLKRVFLGWLRGQPGHCHLAAIPALAHACPPRLAAPQTRSLPHGGHSDAGGGGCKAPKPRARGARP